MEYIQQNSRIPSLFPSGIHVFPVLPFIDSPTSSTSNAICRVVLDWFNNLHSPSSSYSVLCTRDKAVGLPAHPTDVSADSLQEALDTVIDRLYPLLPLSRWISPLTTPHRLAQFLAASGKIQRLRDLLLDFVRTPSETESNQSSTTIPTFRPRVIFIMSHYTAFLDLLTAWLSVDPAFSCLTRIRAPIDHLDANRGQCCGENMAYYSNDIGAGWIELVNDWPCGTRGPLIVLMHGRAHFLSVAGLKAGPDTRIILCDADWRQEIHTLVKSKLRCWSINGLVDVPPRVRYNSSPSSHRLPVYRLVSEWDSGESMEARLLKSSAIHLLPDSVFKTVANTSTNSFDADATSGSRSRLSATSAIVSPLTSSTTSRVQPNVVKELFFKLRRRAQWRAAGGETSTGIPMPSMESDGGEEEVTTQDEESDNASLFHNREPVQKQMLLQCFDLHEAPRDVQAWYSYLAEDTAIAVEMQGNDIAVQNLVEEDLNDTGLIHMATGDFDALCQQQCTEITLVPPEIRERWELDEEMWQKNYSAVENALGYSDPLFFVTQSKYEEEEVGTVMGVDDGYADENDSPILDAFKLPAWVPSFFNDPNFYEDGLSAPYDNFILPTGNSTASRPHAKIPYSFSDPWGYSSEPMSESELAPLPPPSTTISPLFDSTNTTLLPRGSVNAATASSSSYAIKRSAAAALSARSSVGASGSGSGPPPKRKRLTGAAAMAAKRSASNKAAAAAAALAKSTASSSGRVSHLDSDEKSPPTSSTHDRSEVPIVSTGPSTSTTTSFTTISSNQKACLPRTLFARDVRAITGSSAAAALQSNSGGGFGSSASSSNSYFTPTARFRRTTAGVSNFSRLSGVTGTAGGASLPGGGAAGVYAALNNPHLHAKYALPMIGKSSMVASVNAMPSTQRQAIHTASGIVSFKFGSTGHVTASFNDVKPPEWTPLEEAALLMYTNKLLETPTSTANSHHHHSSGSSTSTVSSSGLRVPNFRLAELCLNSFISMRAYRNARQCLIAYCRINSVVVNSSPNDLLPHPLGDVDKTGQHQHHHQAQHGVGRKVKNKMKSGLSSTPLISSSSGIALHGGSSLGVPGGAGDSPDAGSTTGTVNKLRGYQHFLYLQSQLNSLNVTAQSSISVPSSTNISTLDSQSVNIMRRCIRECSLKHSNHPPGAPGNNKHPLQFHPASASPTAHHHLQSAVGQVGSGSGQRSGGVGPVATTATMLMRNAAAAVASGNAGGPTQQQQLTMPAPLIQKNPSHIAALQECNISPDNLITPAIVIKNKEEREARQRTEAVNAASVVAAASASLTGSGNVASTSSTVTVMATSAAPAASTAAVVVGHPPTISSGAAARGIHHSQQQHPTIVTISGTGQASGSTSGAVTGAAIPRSANILPFSSATSVSYHGGSSGSPTVFRYTTPNAAGRQVATTAATTGILRRVTGPGGTSQSVFAVTPASGTVGATHVISNTGGTTVMRRSVTLTPAGSSQPQSGGGGVNTATGGGGGVTVLATASGTRPGSVIYHQHHSQGTAGAPTGITLLPAANAQGLPQIIRPRQQFRPGAPLPAQRFVRTFSATGTSSSPIGGSGSSGSTPPTTALVHRSRDGLYASSAQHQQSQHRGNVVVPESQILLQRIPSNAQRRHGGTITTHPNSVVGRHQSQQQQPPSNPR